MCGGVQARVADKVWKIYFPNPKAALPVLQADGTIEWAPWGRRREQPSNLPATGWARQDSITAGKWARYRPRFVCISAERFMEKDANGVSHWFNLDPDQAIEALLLELGEERRVYVVTTTPPEQHAELHDRWPSRRANQSASLHNQHRS